MTNSSTSSSTHSPSLTYTWRAGVFLIAQATQITLCLSAISCRTKDETTGRSWLTGDGFGTQMTWSCRRQCVTTRAPWVSQTDDLWPVDLETGMLVASKVGNLQSEIGHARPSGSRVIRYVWNRRTDRWTDWRTKAKFTSPFPMGWGIINIYSTLCCKRIRRCTIQRPPITTVSHATTAYRDHQSPPYHTPQLPTETTHHHRITCHNCLLSIWSSVNNQLWKFVYKINRVSHP